MLHFVSAGVLAAWLSGHLALSTLPGLVFTLSNTYGKCAHCMACHLRLAAIMQNCNTQNVCVVHFIAVVNVSVWLGAGLIVCILLLGYGLVEIPRVLWRRSFPEKRLRWHYHRRGHVAAGTCTAAAVEHQAWPLMPRFKPWTTVRRVRVGSGGKVEPAGQGVR